jgi:hypothetical protein
MGGGGMSAPLRLTSGQVKSLSSALDRLSAIRRDLGIDIGAYGDCRVTVIDADATIELSWSDDDGYVIDDRNGR